MMNYFNVKFVSKDSNLFTFIHRKTTELQNTDTDLIYTFDYIPKMNYNRSVLKPRNQLEKRIREFFIFDKGLLSG